MARKKHAHHGGSWKVAFADFMTAMFALFLVMWLVGLSPEQKEGIATFFKTYSIFKNGNPSAVKMEGSQGNTKIPQVKQSYPNKEDNIEKIEKNIKETFKDSPDVIKNHLVFEKSPEGLRIDLVDSEGESMFQVGNKELTPKGMEIVDKVAKELGNYNAPIVIEGHTDALAYVKTGYSNWELSTERAISAKKELVKNGFLIDNIESITGYADTKLLIKDDKYDPRNRRISILVRK